MIDTPHFAYPFDFSGNAVNVVEQDTLDELLACANVIALCPTGFLLARPDFGWAWPEFRNIPLDTSGLVQAMNRFAPVANYSASDIQRTADASIRTITLQMQQVAQ